MDLGIVLCHRGATLSSALGSAVLTSAVLVAGCAVPIAKDLGEQEANQALVALERSGVSASKQPDVAHEGRWQLEVTRGDAALAVNALTEESLPALPTPGVLEALGQGSLVPSRTVEQAKWLAGTAGDLEASLRAVDGVLSARVHLAAPPRELLSPEHGAQKPSASVLIRHRGPTPPIAAGDVQRLVAGAVPGLAPDAVGVISSTVPPKPQRGERNLAQLGPITVTQASLLPLKLTLGAAIALNLLLLGLFGWFWTRNRRAEARLAELERADAIAGES
jgi:type III secretion protein J